MYTYVCMEEQKGGTLSPCLIMTVFTGFSCPRFTTLCQAHDDYQGIVLLLPLWQGSACGVLLSWLCASTVYLLI